jgi:hypothetical protein
VLLTDEDDCSVKDAEFFDPELYGPYDPLSKFRCFREGVQCDGDDVWVGPRTDCRPEETSPLMHKVSDYADFVRDLKADDRDIVVTAITGSNGHIEVEQQKLDQGLALVPSCVGPVGAAYPAVRLEAFAAAFPQSGGVASLCDDDGDPRDFDILASTGRELRQALGEHCLAGHPTDVDPDVAGTQLDCVVDLVAPTGRSAVVPACADPLDIDSSAVTPCYAIKTGAAQCTTYPSQLALQVNWGPSQQPPLGHRTRVECVVDDVYPPLIED